MTYKFTNRAKKAIEFANELALELGHSYIGTEHILYGLACEESGVASRVLEKQNITPENIIDKIEELMKDGSEKAMIRAGKLLAREIMCNTEDNTGDFLDGDD